MAGQIAHKTSRKTKAAQDDALDQGIRITLLGEEYVVRYGDVTSQLARELRAATGFGWNGLLDVMSRDPDLDMIAAFVWFARRVQGERVELDDVVLTYRDLVAGFEVDVAKAYDPEGGRPEV